MNSLYTEQFVDFIVRRRVINPTHLEALARELPDLTSAQAIASELVQRGWLTEFQRDHLLAGTGEKLIFGPYRLIQPLGEGGMGMVFKAWHSRLDRVVALKFVRPQYLSSGPQIITRFHREAQAIAQLNHPNVVLLYDADEIEGVPYIAMEFVNGKNLGDIVKSDGPLGIRRACEYMRQTALGLQHAHECELVHRDIKPSNILVAQKKPAPRGRSSPKLKRGTLVTIHDRERARQKAERAPTDPASDTVKILDMGLARLRQSLEDHAEQAQSTALTEMGAVLGTPDFISPEQARNPRNVDIRSDLYSLGCTFYCILTAQFPFPGGNAMDKLIRHQTDEPKPVRALRADVPGAIELIVQRLMAKHPDDRLQTPQELADVLAAWLASTSEQKDAAAGELPSARPPIVESICPGPTRPHTPAPNSLGDTRETAIANGPDSARGGSSSLLFWNTSISLGNVAFPDATPSPGAQQETLPNPGHTVPSGLSTQPFARLQAHGAVVSALALSADARYAASGDVGGQVRIWDLQQNPPVELAGLMRPAEIHALEFAPNDPRLLIIGEAFQGKAAVRRWDWARNQLADLGDIISLNQPGVGCIGFSADGSTLAVGVGSFTVTWRMQGREATNRTVFKGMTTQIRGVALSPREPLLATVGQSGSMKFWELKKRSWSGHRGIDVHPRAPDVTSAAFSPDGRWLAIVGLDSRLVIWDMVGTTDAISIELSASANLQHVQFSPDGRRLVAVGISGEVFYCDVQPARVVQDVKLNLNMAYRFTISADATRFLGGYSNGSVAFFNLPKLP